MRIRINCKISTTYTIIIQAHINRAETKLLTNWRKSNRKKIENKTVIRMR